MAWVGVLTNAGTAALEDSIANNLTVDMNVVKVGSGTCSTTADMKTKTDLVTPVSTGSLSSMEETMNGVLVRMIVGPHTTAYTLKEVGLFATVGTGGSAYDVMLALFQDIGGSGYAIPTSDNFPEFRLRLTGVLDVENTDNLSITVPSTVYVAQNQGTENAGKFLVVDDTGLVSLLDVSSASGGEY